ncbi:TPA: hypothetical protein N0F65_011700 [Lagenidium giganteum]|uniref:Uncharacterized protein n=1 Tax=Lagenidium giganteum TaxID=4803 RepID=A0AAV2YYI5_9STRA|nr:TPA: hypothetical protein N0F65_011700 [Lagenidium giganteum]
MKTVTMTAPAALLLKLRWRPWLAAVVGVTALFIVAVVVVTFSKLVLPRVRVDKNDAIKDTVDRFNAISGALMSVADEPLVFAVKAFVPVVFTLVLRPMANPTLDTNEVTGQWRHQITKSTRAIACVAITAAVTNALASVNLQHVETSFEARMSATDAKVLRPADVNNATSFFQSLVGSRQSFVDSKCTGGNGSTGYTPSVRFDLQARPFFQDILPMTIEPNQTRSFSMDLQRALNETVIEHEVGEMPFHSSIANALLALSAGLEYNASKSEAEQLAQTHELALKEFISFPGNTTKSMGFELKHEHANITFSRTLLASHVVFDSVTIDRDSMRLVSINQVMPSENDHDKQAVNHTVELVNPTRRYEISAGILRWTTYDLANSHGAKCIDANSSCMGFQYPLDGNSSQVLLVEKNRLFQNRYTLAMNVQSRLIRPSNFRSQVGNPAIFQGDNCSLLAENYIEYVEKNHLFMDRDQIEYVSSVAGMFHLFEKARLYDVIHVIEQARPNEQNQDSTATTLSFDGNIKFVHLGVMIPNDAAIVSFVSMFGLLGVSLLLLLMELLVWSDDDSEPRMTQATVSETAEVMMDDMQYPKNFLTALILLKPASEDGIQATALRELATLTVEGVTLRLRSPVDLGLFLSLLPALRVLNVSKNHITGRFRASFCHSVLVSLADGLEPNATLQELVLHFNHITDNGAKLLYLKAFTANLQRRILLSEGNQLTAECKVMLHAIAQAHDLRKRFVPEFLHQQVLNFSYVLHECVTDTLR